jgi:hypothetical protein
MSYLTHSVQQSRLILDTLTVSQLIKKFFSFPEDGTISAETYVGTRKH